MAKTSLILEATDTSGKKIQKTFTDVNPEASSADLKTFAQMCNGLTSNTYVRTDRINKINCDTEESGDSSSSSSKTAASITFTDGNEFSIASVKQDIAAGNFSRAFNYNGDADIADFYTTTSNSDAKMATAFSISGDYKMLTVRNTAGVDQMSPCVITIHAPETANYQAATATVTFTV